MVHRYRDLLKNTPHISVYTARSSRANAMFFESFYINFSIISALIVALIFDYVTKFFSYWYIRHVPYKICVPFFGSDYHRVLGIRNTSDEVNTLCSIYKDKYIGCVKSRIPDLILKDVDSIQRILSTDFANFHCRGTGLDRSQDVCIRNNLFYAEGEKWTLLREKLELLLNNMNYEIQDSLHDCLSGTNGDTKVQQLLSGILDAVFKNLLIDNKIDSSVMRGVREAMLKRTLFGKLKSYLKDIFPSIYVLLGLSGISGQFFGKFVQVLEDSKLMKDIKKAESIFEEESDRKNIRKESNFSTVCSYVGLFVEQGYVPCHYVLTALLYELARNPEVQDKARKCVDTACEDDYLGNTIKETLRMYPPHSIITRKCVKTYQFPKKDLVLEKNITITIPVEDIQKDEANYKEAGVFNPSRFLDGDRLSNSSFLSFGAGPRKCIGKYYII